MFYEVWDTSTANIVASVPTQTEALDIVRRMVERNGTEIVHQLALVEDDGDEHTITIAHGGELSQLVMERLRA